MAAVGITWECLSNLVGEEAFSARLAIRNLSDAPIAAGWELYFNTCRRVLADTVDAGYRVDHLNGDLFRLRATGSADWLSGQALEIGYVAQFWAISVTDAPLGFYLIEADGQVSDLGDPEILPFARPEQLHRNARDLLPPGDAERRYRENAGLRLLPPHEVGRITPRTRTDTRLISSEYASGPSASTAPISRTMRAASPASAGPATTSAALEMAQAPSWKPACSGRGVMRPTSCGGSRRRPAFSR